LFKNVDKSTKHETADDVDARALDVKKRLVTLRPETEPVECTVFKLSYVFGHFYVITDHREMVIARYTEFGKDRTLVALSKQDTEQLLAIEHSRRRKWEQSPMYVISKSWLQWNLAKPPLVNLWVIDKTQKKQEPLHLINYYRKFDEVVRHEKIEFSRVALYAEEADTSQEPVTIRNEKALPRMGRDLVYFVQCVHQLKDETNRRLVTLRNTDEHAVGYVNVMGWKSDSGVTVLKPEEVASVQERETNTRKTSWAKNKYK
jgi:hypothetical protein